MEMMQTDNLESWTLQKGEVNDAHKHIKWKLEK